MTGPGGGPGKKEGGENPEEQGRDKRVNRDDNDKSNREERKHHDKPPGDHKKNEKKRDEAKKDDSKKDDKPKGKPYDPSNREMHEGLKPYDVPKSPKMPMGGGGSSQMAETKELPNPGGRKELKDEMEERLKKQREENARQQQAQRRLASRL